MIPILTLGPVDAPIHILLAHGAGAPMTSPFLENVTGLLTERGLRVSRFEFAYTAQRREGGSRRPPPKAEKLVPEYLNVVAQIHDTKPAGQPLLIGGKSMGGRVASLCADALFKNKRICGLVCLGYPFHRPGKPGKLRTVHLEDMQCPVMIVQGERDPFGARSEVEAYRLSPRISFTWAGDGDHDLGARRGSGFTSAGNLAAGAEAVSAFALKCAKTKKRGTR